MPFGQKWGEGGGVYNFSLDFTTGEITVRAETVTELILEKAGPIIFETFLLE